MNHWIYLTEEINNDDEQEVPGNDEDNIDEPPKRHFRCRLLKTDFSFSNVCKHADYIHDYRADLDNNLWFCLTMVFPATQPRIDLERLIRSEASRTSITSIVGIQNCFIRENKEYRSKIKTDSNDIEYILSTEGENINALMTYYQIFDLCRIYTNNIHRMVEIFGIEAANRTLIREINRIFLDYMTYEGVYKSCNRFGLKTNGSSLQKRTFKTSTTSLKEVLLYDEHEQLKSP
ncbi:unnamed protein product [Rotaria sordida]|uniref:DNA-directed RNA polymerase n=1 Tax=Rotaria sordida TaxID=392033 RepID=A0A819R8W4_9BILA|nr:unnamed protein product [Rotaria sordida]CAF1240557.1 unnamed protein product [Rotaria sordida]CAF1325899.1 unnamed protein product [Rotaria sordida]CAF1385368.1 unnamed protein product [Rotaria sordida]CAF1515992.1 unnamed protein product [Rotaria sordida]